MLLRPDIIADGVFDITPELLRSRGISLLLADLDNTLAPYGGKPPSGALLEWKAKMLDGGVEIFIVSNTKKPRAGLFADQFGVGYIKHARKPGRAGILAAIGQCGRVPSETALVGDQIFTDVLGANLAGATSIRVRPISLNNPFYRARYWTEQCILFLINGKTYKNR
jgi:HAD superfamily phosphatase (TIGR01668 family)